MAAISLSTAPTSLAGKLFHGKKGDLYQRYHEGMEDQLGTDLAPELVGLIRRMAEFLPRPPIVTTGTNHSPTTTSGNPSDHWTGYAADLGSARNGFPATGGGHGDKIAAAAFLAAGEPPAPAREKALKGGAYKIERGGLRVQIIWKSYVGGDHYNHVHVGLKRLIAST